MSDSAFDTIGGLLTERIGRVPKRGDVVELDDLRFEVLRADARRPHLFLVTRLPKKTVVEEFSVTERAQAPGLTVAVAPHDALAACAGTMLCPSGS